MTSLEQHLTDHAQSTRYVDGVPRCACKCGKWIASVVERGPVKAHRHHVADAWREARTVRTVEELPYGTVIRDGHGFVLQNTSAHPGNPSWWGPGDDMSSLPELPALILWTPEDGAQ